MTCIVALRAGTSIWMGADSMSGSPADYSVSPTKSRKIVAVGDMVIGFTTSWRMGQLLAHPDIGALLRHREGADSDDVHLQALIDVIRNALKDGGFAKVENGVEQGGEFMVARGDRFFTVHSDYSVHEPAEDFTAIGCGAHHAIGYLHAMVPLAARGMRIVDDTSFEPPSLVDGALRCAERYSMGVRGPFVVHRCGGQ